MILLFLFVLLLLLTGYLTLNFLLQRSDASADLGWPEFGFVVLVSGVLIIGWVALTLVELGYFSLPLLSTLVSVYCAGLGGWLLWRRIDWVIPNRVSTRRQEIIVLAILVIFGIILFRRPVEYIFGGADAGVYVNLGAHIANSGQLLIRNEVIADIPAELHPGLFREHPPELGFIPQYFHLPGFYLDDNDPGLIIPQFLALYPTWLAVANSMVGLYGSLYVTIICGILGTIALYWAGREWFNWQTGALAAILLMITPAQIFFARYPTTEALTQFLVWTGFYGLLGLIKRRPGNVLWAVIGGLALGQTGMVRIDMLPLIGLIVIWLLGEWGLGRWRTGHTWFASCFLLTTGHAVYHAVMFSWPYTFNVFRSVFLFYRNAAAVILSVVLVIIGLGLLVALKRQKEMSFRINFIWGRHLIAGGLLTLMLYGYFIRPYLGQNVVVNYWYSNVNMVVSDHLNLVKLGWYVSPLGIGLAALGSILIIEHISWERLWPIGPIVAVFSIFYIAKIANNPHHIYAVRRYLPVVIPTFLVMASYGLVWLYHYRSKWSKNVATVLSISLIAWIGYQARIVIFQVDHRGLIQQVDSLANYFAPDSVILLNDARATGTGAAIGTPLQYAYNHTVFDLQEEKLEISALADELSRWWAEEKSVFLVVGESVPLLEGLPGKLEPISSDWLQTSVLESAYLNFPIQIQRQQIPIEIYRLSPDAESTSPSESLKIDLGEMDYLFNLNGFYNKEKTVDGVTYRWTEEEATLTIPAVEDSGKKSLELRVAGGRPDGISPALLAVYVNDREAGRFELSEGFRLISVPFSTGERNVKKSTWTIELKSSTWSPSQAGISPDDRNLGVMVDWIKVN